jgi:hypothetical protein
MNSKLAKRLRSRTKSICGQSFRDRSYIVLGLRPKADVPPVAGDMTASHHNIRVGVDKEFKTIWFPVVNPIRLGRCGRAVYKALKKQHKGGSNAAIFQ